MTELVIGAFFETIFMVFCSILIGGIFGIPLAVLLFNSSPQGMNPCAPLYQLLCLLINAVRSIPYIILMVLLIPMSQILVGSSIGIYAAIVPLGISAILLVAKVVEDALKTVSFGLIETGLSMGATETQVIWKMLIPEALPTIVSGITFVIINLVGFSAMAGAVGGGGLGDVAIRYGYQRYNLEILGIIVLILICLVQTLQWGGNAISTYLRK
ncbi:MAG: ABC transporter permease [Proteobacteria bacterium]|nr:ABC transporter permease [Pseudomonadota bacterium]